MRKRTAQILTLAVLGAAPVVVAAQTSGSWGVNFDGSWSEPANWLGTVPGGGGIATFALHPSLSGPRTVTQDLPSVQLDMIRFDSPFIYSLRPPPGSPTNGITLSGNAEIHADAGPADYDNLNPGHVIAAPLSGTAGMRKTGPGTLVLGSPSNFSGNIHIDGGTLRITAGDAALGHPSGTININNATLRTGSTTFASSRRIHITGSASIQANSPFSHTNIISGGGGTLTVTGNNITLSGPNTYTGAVEFRGASTQVADLSGSFLNVAHVGLSGQLSIGAFVDRFGDSTPWTMRGGELTVIGGTIGPMNETIGPVTFASGLSRWQFDSLTDANPTSITAESIARGGKGAAFFRGRNLGAAPAQGNHNIYVTSPPAMVGGGGAAGSTNISIIPWAYGSPFFNGGTNSHLTYDLNGIRPLNPATEYVAMVSPGVSQDNLRVEGVVPVNSAASVNSVLFFGGTTTGSGPLTVTSGTVLVFGNNSAQAPLDFGPAEGILHTSGSLTIAAPVSGSGGLTKTSAGMLMLRSAASTYTGTTTLTGGETRYDATNVPSNGPGVFGADTSPIVFDAEAGSVTLRYDGTGTARFNRPLHVAGGPSMTGSFGTLGNLATMVMNGDVIVDTTLSVTAFTGSIIFNGEISGAGRLTNSTTSSVRLNGANTYSGGTSISIGTWAAGNDAAFGVGPLRLSTAVSFPAPTIMAVDGPRVIANDIICLRTHGVNIGGAQPLTFTGDIELSDSFTHTITNSATTTYAGVLHSGGLDKAGPGRLVLSGDNVYTGPTRLSGGVLRIEHPNALGTSQSRTIMTGGATLEIASSVQTLEPVEMDGGTLHSLGGTTSVGPVALGGSATIIVNPGTLAAGPVDATSGSAVLTKNGGGPLVAHRFRVPTIAIGLGAVNVAPGRSVDKTSRVSQLDFTLGTRLDLGDNDLVFDYDTTSPLLFVRSNIASAHSGGNWIGPGISSAQADAASFALGYAEATSVFGSLPAVFSGQIVDDTTVLIRWTRYGDADLNGSVNLDDFNRLAANFGMASGAVWSQGDFDYTGSVNLVDFNRLAANFGLSATLGGPTPQDWANLASAVPEPAGVASLLLGGIFFRRRARNCRSRRPHV